MDAALSLTSDPIPYLTRRIAVPVSVGMFFQTMFNVVDTYFAGMLNTDALAALSLSFPLFFLLISVGSGLSQGTTALLANALGAGDREGARQIFAQAIVFAVGVSVAAMILGWIVAPGLFEILGASGNYLELTLDYVRMILAGSVFFVLTMTINSALSAEGATKFYRNFLIAGFAANCLLNPLLIWGFAEIPGLGVTGLALATVLIQVGGCLYLWLCVQNSATWRSISPRLFRPNIQTLGRITGQSLPAALNMATIAAGIFIITWFVQQFGKEAVAAVGIATRIEQLLLMPVIGLSTATLTIVGQNYGAGFPQRIREAWIINTITGTGLMLLGGGLLLGLGKQGVALFTSDASVIAHGTSYLFAASLTLAAYPILFVTVFMMQGLKRPLYGLWIGVYRQIAAPILVFHTLCFVLGWGVSGVWWGFFFVTWSAALFALSWGWKTVCNLSRIPATPRSLSTEGPPVISPLR